MLSLCQFQVRLQTPTGFMNHDDLPPKQQDPSRVDDRCNDRAALLIDGPYSS